MTDRELMQQALDALGLAKSSHNMVLTSDPPQSAWRYYNVDMKLQETITALRDRLAQPEKEPLEYWNAVEGWVKIDEVREHFESVNCGTIYKKPGEGRVPLYAAPRQWVGLTDDEVKEIIGPWGDTPIKGYTRKLFDQIENKLREKNT